MSGDQRDPAPDPNAPTSVPCPACDGSGSQPEEHDYCTEYLACDGCMGSGWINAHQVIGWLQAAREREKGEASRLRIQITKADQKLGDLVRIESFLDIASGQEFFGETVEQGIERLDTECQEASKRRDYYRGCAERLKVERNAACREVELLEDRLVEVGMERDDALRDICDLHEDHWDWEDQPALIGSPTRTGRQLITMEGMDCIACVHVIWGTDAATYLKHRDKCWTPGEESQMENSGAGYPGMDPYLNDKACTVCRTEFGGQS